MSANQSQHRPANRLRQRAPRGDDLGEVVKVTATAKIRPVSYTITFSEPVTGVDPTDFALAFTGSFTAATAAPSRAAARSTL
jgi:hypothetical protein